MEPPIRVRKMQSAFRDAIARTRRLPIPPHTHPKTERVIVISGAFYLAMGDKLDQVINYAQNRASFRSGEIGILDSSGNVERVIAFNETERKL